MFALHIIQLVKAWKLVLIQVTSLCSPRNPKISMFLWMKVLKVFSLHISLQICHLLLKLLIYAMQKLLRQSQNLINRRISRCIRTLKHLHPLAAIVHSTSITEMMSWKSRTPFFFNYYCIHYANLSLAEK